MHQPSCGPRSRFEGPSRQGLGSSGCWNFPTTCSTGSGLWRTPAALDGSAGFPSLASAHHGRVHAARRTDRQGNYFIPGVPAGTYHLMVYYGYHDLLASTSIDVRESGSVQKDINIH